MASGILESLKKVSFVKSIFDIIRWKERPKRVF